LRGPLPERYPANISTQAKARLVVVHDDELLRSALQGLLKAVGLQAQAFPWAEEFLKSGVQHQTACLIADIRMPGMSGVELQANAFLYQTSGRRHGIAHQPLHYLYLSNRMAAACGPRQTPDGMQGFSSPYPAKSKHTKLRSQHYAIRQRHHSTSHIPNT
jgi:CheY-like chemotaxis protein